ncbi:MAG TPA: glyoxalase superfamily protein [Blastocatellia bacterium]|nr:glyoxalase superfamily protein [Blastocatellia bacterium]
MKGNAQLMPMISVDSVEAARTFYVEKLGFDHMMGMLGKDGQLDFCTVVIGGGKVMLRRPEQKTEGTGPTTSKRPVEIYFEVEDVNAYHDQLKKRGVRMTSPLTDQWWGDRTFTVVDPFGYQIWFYQTVDEPRPPQGAKIV